jgi:delta14-sterol reductase
MLVFGDYVFIPFTFNIQCHFLVEMPEYNHVIFWFVIQILLFALGYYIFRTANSQKNQFKMNPKALINGKEPEVF